MIISQVVCTCVLQTSWRCAIVMVWLKFANGRLNMLFEVCDRHCKRLWCLYIALNILCYLHHDMLPQTFRSMSNWKCISIRKQSNFEVSELSLLAYNIESTLAQIKWIDIALAKCYLYLHEGLFWDKHYPKRFRNYEICVNNVNIFQVGTYVQKYFMLKKPVVLYKIDRYIITEFITLTWRNYKEMNFRITFIYIRFLSIYNFERKGS